MQEQGPRKQGRRDPGVMSGGQGSEQGQGSRPGAGVQARGPASRPAGVLWAPLLLSPPWAQQGAMEGPARSPSCLLPSHPLCSSEPPRGPSIGAGSSVDTSKPLRMARGSGLLLSEAEQPAGPTAGRPALPPRGLEPCECLPTAGPSRRNRLQAGLCWDT